MSYGISKKGNSYALAIVDIDASKTVFMAIALSFALRIGGTGNIDEARQLVMDEWTVLHQNGIVPQKPKRVGDDMDSKPQHVCQFPEDDSFCGHCGAELNDNGSCDNDHAPEAPYEAPKAFRTVIRLADMPRFLAANGNAVLSGIAKEELAEWHRSLAALSAVLHQMEHGEASDVFDIGVINPDTQHDLRWCRDEIKKVITALS